MARRAVLRASDSEREQIADRLRRATVEGRLLAEELEERLGAALRARTLGELDALVADLPHERSGRLPRPTAPRLVALAVALLLVLAVIATVVLLLTGIAVGFVWVLAGWWVFGHRGGWCGRRRLYRA